MPLTITNAQYDFCHARLFSFVTCARGVFYKKREKRADDGEVNLATALQYAPATGLARTQTFIREFSERVYASAYDNWTTLVHTGNTDGYVVFVIVTFSGWCD